MWTCIFISDIFSFQDTALFYELYRVFKYTNHLIYIVEGAKSWGPAQVAGVHGWGGGREELVKFASQLVDLQGFLCQLFV
jgi:hypothetical protein